MDDSWLAVPVTLIVFGSIASLVLGPIWFKERTKRSAHQLIAQALEKGQTLDPAIMQRLTESIEVQQKSPRKTLGSAVVMIALALGFIGASFLDDGNISSGDGMVRVAFILGALGIAFLVLALVDYNSKKKDA
jgi:Domain of unknown function (DUF6249)